MTKELFNSDLELATPAQVIFKILEDAAREKKFSMFDEVIMRHLDVDRQINEYVERLLSPSNKI